MDRRNFLTASLAGAAIGTWSEPLLAAFQVNNSKIKDNIAWYNVEDWGIEGRAWSETKSYFDRLPAKAEKTVRAAVWGLSRHSAGMVARFASNSKNIRVRYELTKPNLAMAHMPATGVSGVDLYAENELGESRWVNVSRPASQKVNASLAANINLLPENKSRNFSLYLPLYNGVKTLEIGVDQSSEFKGHSPRKEKPILFYGTSIMHGACASRPGMSISSILGRRLNTPVINLGFSGNGKMESEVVDLICEKDISVFVVDCLPNMNATLVKERTIPLVKQFRKTHPTTPILLVEDRTFTNSEFFKNRTEHHAASRRELKAAYTTLIQSGAKNVHYLTGKELLGVDGEGATDGSHPNDLGMMRYADAYEKALKPILKS